LIQLTTLIANVNRDQKKKALRFDDLDPWSETNRLRAKPADTLTAEELYTLMMDKLNG
jgi:hypothetical protein